jgi:VanZ family protein
MRSAVLIVDTASRQTWLLLVAVWVIVLLYLSLTPSPPQVEGPLGWDKLQHGAALGVMAFLLFRASLPFRATPFRAACIGFVGATLFGGLIEILQGTLTVNRQADPLDFAADAVGAVIAVLLPQIRSRLRVDR